MRGSAHGDQLILGAAKLTPSDKARFDALSAETADSRR